MPGGDDPSKRPTQRTVRSDREIQRVTAARETSHQVGDVNLSTSHLACRANLEDFHESLRWALRELGIIKLTVVAKLDNTAPR